MINGFFQLPSVAASQNRGAAGTAFGVRGEAVVEQQSFPRNTIEIRGVHPFRTVSTSVTKTPIVSNYIQNIWTFGGLGKSEAG